jgi:hypothetical protein
MMEDTGWSYPLWPKRLCSGDLREAMVSGGMLGTSDGRRLFKEMTSMGV